MEKQRLTEESQNKNVDFSEDLQTAERKKQPKEFNFRMRKLGKAF